MDRWMKVRRADNVRADLNEKRLSREEIHEPAACIRIASYVDPTKNGINNKIHYRPTFFVSVKYIRSR